ncbi:TfdA family Taurine catabolism dioxygenase TauD [Purpureocillium lilacinum]|uniref:TfdA family Taurine catabolism dioxygenase TauD n=1 Tax=Purpureocillium lilacinum TaxID=33203 RepID=A0A179HLH8_PURLI|nr:TfdA family Taurine catabolism dioxygenase TauD [Purpureocillium lilacinum]OAQ84066.1 TfdA family Taurine catabolism dioxygenase TauD [Purpureocillium lilacinum]OAQ90854.1 TfdA family Taurine catabolism dioxygenase TauD [Purpureocillium lilacinum]GJN68387.1 hypothetical protein PLICBS_002430 [Purpureocillium lilacinum]GJN77938.1 hypothetical protein PLIIFM63780_001431 [Purpureocillium lilacinum]
MAYTGTGPVAGPRALSEAPTAFAPTVNDAPLLPTGFPDVLDSSMAWAGTDFAKHSDFILRLNDVDIKEAEEALEHFKALGLDGDLMSRQSFPLPNLGPRLDRFRLNLHDGTGFGLIRGLDPQRYAVEDLTMLHLGIQCYIANRQGRQDKKGNMLVHIVADNSSRERANHHRHSTAPITFHNEEAGDIISWLTRSTAATGGKCIIASAYTVYNVLAASRPDLVRTLARSDWPFALPRFQCRPVIFYHQGRLITNFGRTALLGSSSYARSERLPKLNSSQTEALDAIESIARATQLEIATQAGDMHFINNLAVLHRREGFVDGEAPTERRHLVRMRLRDDDMGWAIPADLALEWTKAFAPGRARTWHLEPMPDGFFPLRTQPN